MRQGALQLGLLAFKKELRVADGLAVSFRRGESFNAWAEAAVNVVLKAGARVKAREVDLAGGQQEAAMDEFGHAVGQIAGEVRAIVGGAVLAQAAGDEDFGEAVGERELHEWVGFVIAEEDVETGLALLDEVVFEGEGLMLIGDEDGVEVDGLAHERAGFGVGLVGFQQVGADARAEVIGLADVDDLSLSVLEKVDAGLGGKLADFLVKVHERRRAGGECLF